MSIIVRTYKTEKEFNADAEKLKQESWQVKDVKYQKGEYQAGKGCCLFLLFAPLALFARGKEKIVVTYEKR